MTVNQSSISLGALVLVTLLGACSEVAPSDGGDGGPTPVDCATAPRGTPCEFGYCVGGTCESGPQPCDADGLCPNPLGACAVIECQPPGPGVSYPACYAVARRPEGTACDTEDDASTLEECDRAGDCVAAD